MMIVFATLLLLTAVCNNAVESQLQKNDLSLVDLRHFPVKSGHIDIAEQIATDYKHFGTLLLEDKSGSKVGHIEASKSDPVNITAEILKEWLQGKGRKPVTWQTLVNCLRDTDLNILADVIESSHNVTTDSNHSLSSRNKTMDSNHSLSDLLQKEIMRQGYEREMLYGSITISIAKVLLFGNAGSGKTSVTAIMVGDDPPSVRTSTPLMVRPIQVTTIRVKETMEWKKKSPEEVLKMLAEIIRLRQSRKADSQNYQQESLHSEQLQPTQDKLLFDTPSPTPTKLKSEFDVLLESVLSEDYFLSLVNSSKLSSEPILEQRWLYIIDSGGQPEFHNMLSIFVQKTTVCMYVLKIHEELDDYPQFDYYKDGNPVGQSYPSRLTNRQIFEQFMRTLRSFSSKKNGEPPSIVLLATHRDMVEKGKLPELLEERHKQIKAIVIPHFKDQLIYYNYMQKKFIFTMNAKHPDGEDKRTANAIRKVITEDFPGETLQIPIRWYILDHWARNISVHLNRTVLSRKEYGKIAELLNIDERSCEGALNFFSSLNTIFYFPNVLPNLVFLEPQIFLNLLNELVVRKYYSSVQAVKPKEYRYQFHEFAKVTDKLLNEFESHFFDSLFTSRELVALFEKLLIFGKLREGVWFVPSILPSLKKEEVEHYRVNKEEALVINFQRGGPLNGLFCSTVSFLLSPDNTSPSPWKVLMKSPGEPDCLKRNVISFTVENYYGYVTLIEEWTHFEVHVKTRSEDKEDLWGLVYKAMFDGLERAAETHHYSGVDNAPQPAILCPEKHNEHPSTPHPATIDSEGNWRCTKSSKWFGHVSTPWLYLVPEEIGPTDVTWGNIIIAVISGIGITICILKQLTGSAASTPLTVRNIQTASTPLTVKEIQNELREMTAEWYQLGVQLKIPPATLNTIERDHPHDAQRCMTEVMNRWLQNAPESSWAKLAQAVEAMGGYVALAEKLTQKTSQAVNKED